MHVYINMFVYVCVCVNFAEATSHTFDRGFVFGALTQATAAGWRLRLLDA